MTKFGSGVYWSEWGREFVDTFSLQSHSQKMEAALFSEPSEQTY